MDVSQSHMNSDSDSNTLDNSTMTFTEDCNVAPPGFYQRLLHEVMNVPHGDWAQVDSMVPPNLHGMEQLDWEPAPELNWGLSQQQLSWEPTEQLQLNREPSQETQYCPPASETVPEFSTVDQSEETSETEEEDGRGEDGCGEDGCGEEDQSPGSGGECSYNHTDESTSGLTALRVLPPGEKIGVSYHKKNKQWQAHLWIRGPQLRKRKKKGVQIFLGNFEAEEEAKVAHDRAAIKLKIQTSARGKPYMLNFPAAVHASYMEEHADWTDRDFLWKIRRTSNKFSKGKSSLKGVNVKKQSVKRGQESVTKYEAKLSLTAKEFGDDMKQTFMLGIFDNEEEAGQAYDRALLYLYKHKPEVEQLRCITNFRPTSYSAEDIEAWARKCKLPVRDNDDNDDNDDSGSVPA